MGKKAKKSDKKGKKQRKDHVNSKKWEAYKDGKRIKKICPKCGPGVFMAEHKDRYTCGKCGYTEFKK